METSPIKSLLQVSLLVRGTHLDPDEVTRVLGASPSKVNRRGSPKIRDREKPVFDTTTWKFSIESDFPDVSSLLMQLLSALRVGTKIGSIDGVEDAFLDVFMANTVMADDKGASIDFGLSTSALASLNSFQLPVKFSLCNVEE